MGQQLREKFAQDFRQGEWADHGKRWERLERKKETTEPTFVHPKPQINFEPGS